MISHKFSGLEQSLIDRIIAHRISRKEYIAQLISSENYESIIQRQRDYYRQELEDFGNLESAYLGYDPVAEELGSISRECSLRPFNDVDRLLEKIRNLRIASKDASRHYDNPIYSQLQQAVMDQWKALEKDYYRVLQQAYLKLDHRTQNMIRFNVAMALDI